MKLVATNDGTATIFNATYNEHYHSISGAKEEAIKKFIEPCRIKHLDKPIIIDIGFGLGYNVYAALQAAKGKVITVYSFEQDNNLIPQLKKEEIWSSDLINELSYDPKRNIWSYETSKEYVQVLIGNADTRIKELTFKANAIFLDPFSPKKNPELWTVSFFKELRSRITNEGILATYSCARNVRENLIQSGFTVYDGPKVGRRGPSTIAQPVVI